MICLSNSTFLSEVDTGATHPTSVTPVSHHESTEILKSELEWSDHGENLSECSTHVLSKCTNFGDDPISLRVRKRDFWKKIRAFFFLQEMYDTQS